MNIDVVAYETQASRYEAEAALLAPDDPRRIELERMARSLRADIERGASAGLTSMGKKL